MDPLSQNPLAAQNPLSHAVKSLARKTHKLMDAVERYEHEDSWENLLEVAWTWHELGEVPINVNDDHHHSNDLITSAMVEHVGRLAGEELLDFPNSFVAHTSMKDPSIVANLTGERPNKVALFAQGAVFVVFEGPDYFYSHSTLTDAVEFVMANWTREFDVDDSDAGDDPKALDRDQLRNAITEEYTVNGIEGVRKMVFGGMYQFETSHRDLHVLVGTT